MRSNPTCRLVVRIAVTTVAMTAAITAAWAGDGPGARRQASTVSGLEVVETRATLPGGVAPTPSGKTSATVLSDGFEGTFPGSQWQLWHPSTGAAAVDWGKSTYRKASGAASIWCAGAGAQSPGAGGMAPANTASWVIAGPFDLSGVSSGTLSFDLWLDTETNYDYFKWLASFDGSNFSGLQTSQSTSGFQRVEQDLTDWGTAGDVTGRSQVWIAFLYDSDGDTLREGAYVDNVALATGGGGGGSCGTYVLTADNDDNRWSGSPDGDWGYCLYNDDAKHPIEFRFDLSQAASSSAQLLLLCNDVDRSTDPSNPEIDKVYVNGTYVGALTGANEEDSTTLLTVPVSALTAGSNRVRIDVNQNPGSSPDDWCVEVKQAQLVVDGGCQGSASCRSVTTDHTSYAPGATVAVTYEVDTSRTSQQVRVESNLVSPGGVILAGADRVFTVAGTANEPQTVQLTLPTDAPSGTYTAQVLVFDATTGGLESSCQRAFTVTGGGGGACTITCSASVPATAQVGIPVTFQGSATPTGCTSTVEYFWFPDEGNTATIFDRNASWTYTAPGTYRWNFVVISGDARCEKTGTINVTSGGNASCNHRYWVPVASRANGVNNSLWRTDVGLLNRGSATATVEVRLDRPTGPLVRTTTLAAGRQLIQADVLGWLSPGFAGSGPLRICSDRPLSVTSRTYNLIAAGSGCFSNGTMGQALDGAGASETVSAGQTVWLPQLVENTRFRSNLGFTNTGAANARLTVSLYAGNGSLLTSFQVNLAPGEWKQDSQPFRNRAGQTGLAAGSAAVRVEAGSGIVVYGSVIDNVTGDPTTVRMRD